MSDNLASNTRPVTDATITVRIIKSFKYRTEKSLVLHHIDLTKTTVGKLKEITRQVVSTKPEWKKYRNVVLGDSINALKFYTKAHGAKASNLIINLDHDEWILNDDTHTLVEREFENETEVSFFSLEDYKAFKLNPETIWDT